MQPLRADFSITRIHPPAIYLIRDHVHQKSDSRNAGFRVKKQKDINPYSPIGMQWMKCDTTAICVKNRRSEKMIQIHQHGQ